MTLRSLTAIEIRVLGTLMEKCCTVPDSYPMSLNALINGCNQKTSRDPLMDLDETQVQTALDELKFLSLVIESSGSRVSRYEHNIQRVLGIPSQSAALLGVLMLRGPQTSAELRINTERWHRFADTSSVEAFLEELQERSEEKGGSLVHLMPRQTGMREARWCHLLAGPAPTWHGPETHHQPADHSTTPASMSVNTQEIQEILTTLQALQQRVQALEEEIKTLRS